MTSPWVVCTRRESGKPVWINIEILCGMERIVETEGPSFTMLFFVGEVPEPVQVREHPRDILGAVGYTPPDHWAACCVYCGEAIYDKSEAYPVAVQTYVDGTQAHGPCHTANYDEPAPPFPRPRDET